MKAMLAVIALSATTFAQEPSQRYEFLWRLRNAEARWRAAATVETRQLIADDVGNAQTEYASGDVARCCKALDDAGRSIGKYSVMHGTDAYYFKPARRLCDRGEHQLEVYMSCVYPGGVTRFALTCRSECDATNSFRGEIEAWLWKIGQSIDLALDSISLGDRAITLRLVNDDGDNSQRDPVLSIVDHRDERLAALKASIEKLNDKAPALERETAKATLALLESLTHGSTEAHEYPGARLLAETEQVVAAAAKGERWYTPERSGEFWLSLPIDGASVRTRVLVPEGLSRDKSAPLVVAFHGAAFDEDVWFDGYGGGAAVEQCRKRGWIFAAPHCDGSESPQRVEAAIDALARVYPVDPKHVFLLAHSRGAGTALRAQAANATRYCGVAAIGNALDDASAKALANHPLFLAAGDHDFAREAVTAMSKTLTDAGSKSVKLTIYPNTEHWLAVQAALPDAFAWFDSLAK
jgi:poly(3-hydroxybutyrate) depolymerase